MAESVSTPLLRFYRGQAPDAAGRRIYDIWGWDYRRLEMVHDYIQWLFPNPEPSRFNPDAPLLTKADVNAFHGDADLRGRLLRSLALMLDFYGLVRAGAAIARGPAFKARAADWLTPTNHNYLRLSRILLCLHLMGLDAEASSFLSCLDDIATHEGSGLIAPRTLDFWRTSLTAKLL